MDTTTVAFLRAILPATGLKCVAIHRGGVFRHSFFNSIEDMAAFILQQDAAEQVVYFACASYRVQRRKAAEALAVRALWADVDVGPDKPYKTAQEAQIALLLFCDASGMPLPTVIGSGSGGLHLYWPLDVEMTREQWLPYAQALKQLFRQHGFHIDPTRTADAASVLRPPGTHNRKSGSARPVMMLRPLETFKLAELPLTPALVSMRPAPAQGRVFSQLGDTIYPDAPSDPDKIAAECAQMRRMRDLRGNIPEPEWRNCLGVLKYATDGLNKAHEWSDGHPTYSEAETDKKFELVIGPTLCTTFEGMNAEPCKGCPHREKIKTPLQLGRAVQKLDWLAQKPPQAVNGHVVPEHFVNDARGLQFATEDKNGDAQMTLISAAPIVLQNIYRDEQTSEKHSLLFTLKRKTGDVAINISCGELFGPRGMSIMHERGAVIHEYDLFRRYVRETMDQHHANHSPEVCFEQFGWKNDDTAFLFGDHLYTADAVVPVTGSAEITRRAHMLGARSGDLATWTAAANQLFAAGQEPQSFALLCSFAAPLMRFHAEDEGGAIVNLVSDRSSTGKTTSLEAGASVWGGLNGLKLTDEDTRVSRGLLLGALGNLPCMFDELHNRDPDAIRQFCIMFTNGRDKLRATMDGRLRLPSGEWQTILILGSNLSLVDIMHSKNPEEAQAYRVLEFITDSNFDSNEGDRLRRVMRANCGHAGHAYLRYILQPAVLEAIKLQLPHVTEMLWQETKWDKRHRFWIRTLACVYIAGKIVTSRGWLNFNIDRIMSWAIKACSERIEEHGGDGPRDYAQVLNDALAEMIDQTLYTADEWRPKHSCLELLKPRSSSLAIRAVRDTGRLYIRKSPLNRWLLKNAINKASFVSDLKKRNVLLHSNKFTTMGAGTDYAIIGQQMCYEFDLHHAALSGTLMELEKLIPAREREKRPLADVIQLRPRSGEGSPPPPPSAR